LPSTHRAAIDERGARAILSGVRVELATFSTYATGLSLPLAERTYGA
jgi:hypothetical protein